MAIKLNGIGKAITNIATPALIIFAITAVWQASAFKAQTIDKIEDLEIKDKQQDACDAEQKVMQKEILLRLIRRDITDSLKDAGVYIRSSNLAMLRVDSMFKDTLKDTLP